MLDVARAMWPILGEPQWNPSENALFVVKLSIEEVYG